MTEQKMSLFLILFGTYMDMRQVPAEDKRIFGIIAAEDDSALISYSDRKGFDNIIITADSDGTASFKKLNGKDCIAKTAEENRLTQEDIQKEMTAYSRLIKEYQEQYNDIE